MQFLNLCANKAFGLIFTWLLGQPYGLHVTGHTHRLTIREYTDYQGVRYGCETGMLADPEDAQFDYALDGPKNWQPGFMVCTFKDGVMLPPERCEVVKGVGAVFRGCVIVSE